MARANPFGIIDFDHVMLRVRSPEHGRRVFEGLGFGVTATTHVGMKSSGSFDNAVMPFDNQVIKFPVASGAINYLELMSVLDQGTLPRQMSFLGDSEGVKTMVLRVESEQQFFEEMTKAGYEMEPSFSMIEDVFDAPKLVQRIRDLTPLKMFFQKVLCPVIPRFGAAPFMFNGYTVKMPFVDYRKLSTAHIPKHPNGAICLDAALGICPDPTSAAAQMAQLWGVDVASRKSGVLALEPGNIGLEIFDQHAFS